MNASFDDEESRRRTARAVVCVALALCVTVGACVTTHFTPPVVDPIHRLPGPVVFVDVSVFDGVSPIVHLHQDVWVEGGVVSRMSSTGRPLPANATVVDGRGKTLLPGLIDAHTHVTATASPPWAVSLPDRAHHLEAHLFAGVTTIVDLAGEVEAVRETRALVESGALVGPRVVVSGPQITPPGGYPGAMIARLLPFPLGSVVTALGEPGVSGVDEARARVRERVAAGVDVVKIALAEAPGGSPILDRASVEAIVSEAHAARRLVFAHVDTAAHALLAAEAGVDALAHGVHVGALDDDDARAIASRGVHVVPTLVVFDRVAALRTGHLSFHPLESASEPVSLLASFAPEARGSYALDDDLAAWVDALASSGEQRRQNVRALARAGAPILVGTDANGAPGVFPGAIHDEMRLLVEAGVPTLEVLRGATSRAARFLGGDDADSGVVEVGKRADLVLVEGNPLFDVTKAARIVVVMQAGRTIVRIGAP